MWKNVPRNEIKDRLQSSLFYETLGSPVSDDNTPEFFLTKKDKK